MRTRVAIIAIAILVILAVLLVPRGHPPAKQEAAESVEAPAQTNEPPPVRARPRVVKEPAPPPKAPQSAPPMASSFAQASNSLYQQRLADWQAPIDFYGKVVDETGVGVAGASIRFHWADMTASDSASTSTTQSDAQGLFSLHGKHGRSLEVWVNKDGYYAAQGGQKGFLYAYANDRFLPDPDNPVLFHLKKKGQGAQLVTSQNGARPDIVVRVPPDGSPVWVDLLKKTSAPTGELQISQLKPSREQWQQAAEWSLTMKIQDGGFAEQNDEFAFEAPEADYQPAIDLHFSSGTTNWTPHLVKTYYIKFGQPVKYGWVRVETDISQESVFLQYAFNPSGSRNLEPAESPLPRRGLPRGWTETIPPSQMAPGQ